MDGPRHTPNRPLRMLWAGRVIDSKGLELALHAVARQLPGACRLDVLGDGPRLGKARQLVNDQRLEAAVHFHGFQPRMSEWYRGADLLLFPSRVENFSLTVLEAMSWGVPVLAMKADGRSFLNCNAEIITHEVDGFIAASERDFIERATELVADPERLVEAGQRARQTVVARFTWDRHLERYESLFRAMAPGCREGTPRGDDA